MTPAPFAQCRDEALSVPPHTPESLSAYTALRAREMASAEERRKPHPQQNLPGVE